MRKLISATLIVFPILSHARSQWLETSYFRSLLNISSMERLRWDPQPMKYELSEASVATSHGLSFEVFRHLIHARGERNYILSFGNFKRGMAFQLGNQRAVLSQDISNGITIDSDCVLVDTTLRINEIALPLQNSTQLRVDRFFKGFNCEGKNTFGLSRRATYKLSHYQGPVGGVIVDLKGQVLTLMQNASDQRKVEPGAAHINGKRYANVFSVDLYPSGVVKTARVGQVARRDWRSSWARYWRISEVKFDTNGNQRY